ncbi:MAG: LysM peptidoglycan-binding domain-containing protein [Gallionellaceae bacterium]
MRKIISLICLLLPIHAFADQLTIRENAPERHVVVKGDTLWGISAQFFNDPWRWQQIWGMNKDSINDPHWIYPGDVIVLDRATGTLYIGEVPPPPPPAPVEERDIVILTPHVREVPSDNQGLIPAIPLSEIGPFLAKPLVLENDDPIAAPRIIGAYEHRELLTSNDVAYVKNLPANKGTQWQIFRPSKKFVDPDTDELLGDEVKYLGDAIVEKFANISTIRITKVVSEIAKGDYLAPVTSAQALAASYTPRAPDKQIAAKVISIYAGVEQAGQSAIITINKGQRDGLENGHVLALYQKGEVLKGGGYFNRHDTALPDIRYGLIFVFRTFHKVSYALVLQTRLPVKLMDTAKTP